MATRLKVQLVWAFTLLALGVVGLICVVLYNSVSEYPGTNYMPIPILIIVAGIATLGVWTNTMLNIAQTEADAHKVETRDPTAAKPLGGPGAADGLN